MIYNPAVRILDRKLTEEHRFHAINKSNVMNLIIS